MADETNLSSTLPIANRTREVRGRKLCCWDLSSGFLLSTFLLGFADSFCFVFTSTPSYETSPLWLKHYLWYSILETVTWFLHAVSRSFCLSESPYVRGCHQIHWLLEQQHPLLHAPLADPPRKLHKWNLDFPAGSNYLNYPKNQGSVVQSVVT